jgi:hypothetical protein
MHVAVGLVPEHRLVVEDVLLDAALARIFSTQRAIIAGGAGMLVF